MTSYQTDAGRNKTNLIANGSVAIILVISLLIGDSTLSIFGISIDSFPYRWGMLMSDNRK